MGCGSSKQQLDQQVTSIPSDDAKVNKASPIKKESPLAAAPPATSKIAKPPSNNTNKESHPASNSNSNSPTPPNAPPPPSAPTSPSTPSKQISRLNLESQQDQEFKRQLETSLKARDSKRKVTLEAVEKAQKRSSQKSAPAPAPAAPTTQEQVRDASQHTSTKYGNLEITLASDDPRGHGSFTSNNSSSSNHNQLLLEQDASGKSHATGRRASRRRSSSAGRKKSPSHHRRRRSNVPKTAFSAEEEDEEDVTKKRRIPANDPRSKPTAPVVVEASRSSHASRRKSHTKKETEESEKEVFVTATDDNTKIKAMADISQLGASGDSLDYLSASGVSLDDDGEGDASHPRRQKSSSSSANRRYKHKEKRATRKGDLDNLLEQDEESSATHINKEDDTKSRKSNHRKSTTTSKSKSLSRQASKNSMSSRHSTSSRKSISSKKSTGSHHRKNSSSPAAVPKKSTTAEKTTTTKPKRKSTTKSPHIPENDPRSAPASAAAAVASNKEKSQNNNKDATPPLSTMSQEQKDSKESSPCNKNETTKRETSKQSTSPTDNSNEATSTKNITHNNATPTTQATSRDSISRMEQIAKSMMGQKPNKVHDGTTTSSSNINQSQHSSLGAPSQHSLGAPSQHSLNCYLPDGIIGSSNKNNSGGAGSRLSQNNLSSTRLIDTGGHKIKKLEELPENMDESAEFAQEDEDDNDTNKGEAGNQMPKNATASTSRPGIAQRIVKKMNPLKKKSTFEGGHALNDSDEGSDDDALVIVDKQQHQTAIDNSYRKSRVSGVLKQIVKKKHKKVKDSAVEQDESDRGSAHDSTGESIHSLDLLSQDPTVGNQQQEQEQQGADPVVFKFDASDTSIAQFDPSALDSSNNNNSNSLLMMHSSCSAVDRIHQRRSVRGKRGAAARSHQASLSHATNKGTAGADDATISEDGGSEELKVADLHNSMSQVDELKAEAAFNTKLRTKKKRPKAARSHHAGQSSHTSSGTDQDDTASVQSSDSRQANEKSTAATTETTAAAAVKTTTVAAWAGHDTSTVNTTSSRSATPMTKDQSLRDGSMKGHSLRTSTDGSAAPTPTRMRQRRRLSETHRNKGPSTPTNPSRRGSAHDASPCLSGGSRENTSQRRRRSDAPKVPTSLDDGADD